MNFTLMEAEFFAINSESLQTFLKKSIFPDKILLNFSRVKICKLSFISIKPFPVFKIIYKFFASNNKLLFKPALFSILNSFYRKQLITYFTYFLGRHERQKHSI